MFTHTRAIMATLLSATLLLAGCVTERGDEPCADGNAVFVSFSVVTPKPVPSAGGSRADGTWGDPYDKDKGNAFDNAINNSQLRVYITDNNCKEVKATVSNFLMGGKTETDDGIQYDYVGIISSTQISALQELGIGKLHVVANAGGDVNILSANPPTFTLSGKPGNGFSAIPMWGVRGDIDFSGIKGGERINAGTVYLLRAMAKVEIIIDPDDADSNGLTAIKEAKLNRYNSTGYLQPNDWNTVKETKEITRTTRSYAPETQDLTIQSAETGGDRTLTFYLPECDNKTTDELTIGLKLATDMGRDITETLYLCQYSDGKPNKTQPFNITRNHIYRYIIRRNATEIKVTAVLLDYQSVDLNPGFGIEVPEEDDDKKGDNTGGESGSGGTTPSA